MEIKKIDKIQCTDAIDLIWSTFLQFEAPDYSEEGIQSFKAFIDDKEIRKTLENSSPYAVPVYHKLGFVDLDMEQVSDGMRYTPMKYER